MFAAVITHCSNGVYDKGRHYRAAEYLSELRILSQAESGSRSMATWQHWNGVDSKSAYASKAAQHFLEYLLDVPWFHCLLEAFQKLCFH